MAEEMKSLTDLLKTVEELAGEVEASLSSSKPKNLDSARAAGEAETTIAKTSPDPKLLEKVDAGFRKRNDEELNKVFQRYWEDEAPVISKAKLKDALEELDIFLREEDVDEYLETMDTSGDGVLDFEEFKRAVHYPGPIEQWAKTMSLAQLLTDSIPVEEGIDALRAVSQMSITDIDRICAVFVYGLKRMIKEHIQNLKESFETRDARDAQADQQASKFEIFSLSCGKIDDFHKGISGRIGEFLRQTFNFVTESLIVESNAHRSPSPGIRRRYGG